MKMSESPVEKGENYPELFELAEQADAPISPDRQDTEALKYLRRIQLNIEELNEIDDMDNRMDMISELADDSVPIATYVQFNAYSQLGLYNYDDSDFLDDSQPRPVDEAVKLALYVFAFDALVNVGLNQ